MNKYLIITADDFGISSEINQGIIKAFQEGVLTSASLLINGEETAEAIALAKNNPNLEVGLHLSIFEGLSLRNEKSTITDDLTYFKGGICLHRHWKQFLLRYIFHRINLLELEQELELQIQKFLMHFSEIKFINATQHLHLLPRIQPIILRLAKKYGIKSIRIPCHLNDAPSLFSNRWTQACILIALGKMMNLKANKQKIFSTNYVVGFDVPGAANKSWLLNTLQKLNTGSTEIMLHPGYECSYLRKKLPWGYKDFNWQDELNALTADEVKMLIRERDILLTTFKNLESTN